MGSRKSYGVLPKLYCRILACIKKAIGSLDEKHTFDGIEETLLMVGEVVLGVVELDSAGQSTGADMLNFYA